MVLLSNEVWRDSFGEDPDVIGETLELDSTSFTVIGVMPQDFRFPRAGMVDVWVPLEQHGTVAGRRVNYGELIARLVDGLSVEQAQERLGGLAAGLNEARPHERVWNVRLVPHDPIRANTDTQRALWVLMTAVVFMLLIAAVNSINLLLARTTVRAREIAVRLALGASRSQVARLLVTEAVLLALTGAALAVAVSKMAIPLILRLMPGELTFFAVTDIVVDARVLVYTFVIAFVVGVTCGAVPALKLVRPSPALPSWAEIHAASGTPQAHRLRAGLIIAEVALSVALLIGAGLLTRSFARLIQVDPGFNPRNLVFLTVSLSPARYPHGVQRYAFFHELREKISALPEVRSSALFFGAPPGAGVLHFGVRLEAEGLPDPTGEQPFWVPSSYIDSNFLDVMEVPLVAGRNFARDDTSDSVIIDREFASFLFSNEKPVGRRFRIKSDEPWLTVVGVIEDLKLMGQDDRQGRFDVLQPLPRGTSDGRSRSVAVRTEQDPASLFPIIREAVYSLDPVQPIWKLQTAREALAESVDKPLFLSVLMILFACAATVLASVGIYSVLSFAVRQRTRELGIRSALGAGPDALRRMVMGDGLLLAGAGTILGLACALGLTRFLRTLLFGVEPTDPLTFVAVSVLMTAIGAIACWFPARKATQVDPQTALRVE